MQVGGAQLCGASRPAPGCSFRQRWGRLVQANAAVSVSLHRTQGCRRSWNGT